MSNEGNDQGSLVAERTFWQSCLWHLSSRRFRTALGAVLAFWILSNAKAREFLGVDEKTATVFTQNILILAGIIIAALTGEKFVPNGNGSVDTKKITDDVVAVVGEAAEKKIDELKERLEARIKKKLEG